MDRFDKPLLKLLSVFRTAKQNVNKGIFVWIGSSKPEKGKRAKGHPS